MTEREEADALAERVLDRHYTDPDDDLAILARQFVRLREREAALAANLDAIVAVCALAGIGSMGQTVLCRVKDLHAALGQQIDRAEAAEAECDRLRTRLGIKPECICATLPHRHDCPASREV